MSAYVCDLCRENDTEKGDTYCHRCRADYGNDTERLDRMVTHREWVRSTIDASIRRGVKAELERILKTESNMAVRREAGRLYIKATEGETK